MRTILPAVLILLPAVVLATGSADPAGSGHWEGTIQIAQKSVKVTVDLARGRTGEWAGFLALPDQQLTPVAFSKIGIGDGSVYLEARESMLGVDAKLSADGQSIEGDFLSAFLLHVPVPIRLRRVAQPVMQAPAGSTLSKDLEGTWEGVVKLGASWEADDPRAGSTIAVQVTLSNGPGGVATGTLKKPGSAEPALALSVIQASQSGLRFEVKGAGAAYVAHLQDNELSGEWRQFDLEPVTLKLARVDAR